MYIIIIGGKKGNISYKKHLHIIDFITLIYNVDNVVNLPTLSHAWGKVKWMLNAYLNNANFNFEQIKNMENEIIINFHK